MKHFRLEGKNVNLNNVIKLVVTMPVTTKVQKEFTMTCDPNMPDYSKDPFFVKKAEKARAFIEKHGIDVKKKTPKGK